LSDWHGSGKNLLLDVSHQQGDLDMMNAMVCTQYGSPDVLQLREVAKPVPRDHEVLVKIHAATATATGLGTRTGKPLIARLFSGLTKPKNSILGVEFAGEIAAIGKDVTAFKVGDPVFGMTGATTPGAYAQFKCMPEDGAMLPKPDNIRYEDAAALVEGGLTALNFLHNKANIRQGQKVLIYGASGSVGTASVQVAKYFGADVTAVCSAANFDLVKSIGADHVIDYRKDDFTKNGQQYDIIFDTVGKRSFADCKGSLTPNGIFLNAGNAATILPMLWTAVFGRKKAILAATYVRSASEIKKDLAMLKELIAAGKIRAVIDRCYPLEKTADAHRYVETGRKKGNVVITIDHNDTSA
jgi:NADPH:quinone reductase-like Zn-dependent oxidoreductase